MAEGVTAHRTSVLFLMLMLLMAVSASSIANAQDADDSEGPGITWELPGESHALHEGHRAAALPRQELDH